MNKDSLAENTRRIIRSDRLELMREYADMQETYCFFASMYEVAYHIHADRLPPRFIEAEKEWLSFGVENHGGGIPPEELFSLLVKLADDLDIKIEKIYANPSALNRFLQDKVKDANIINKVPDETDEGEEDDATYKAHAESETFLNKSARRTTAAVERGWFAIFAITFSDKPSNDVKNVLESIPIEHVLGRSLELNPPFVLIMLKEESKRT